MLEVKQMQVYETCGRIFGLQDPLLSNDLHTTTRKVDAIRNAPAPQNVSEVRMLLSMVQ